MFALWFTITMACVIALYGTGVSDCLGTDRDAGYSLFQTILIAGLLLTAPRKK